MTYTETSIYPDTILHYVDVLARASTVVQIIVVHNIVAGVITLVIQPVSARGKYVGCLGHFMQGARGFCRAIDCNIY